MTPGTAGAIPGGPGQGICATDGRLGLCCRGSPRADPGPRVARTRGVLESDPSRGPTWNLDHEGEGDVRHCLCAQEVVSPHRIATSVVCTDHQPLQSWHKGHVDTPSGPAALRARWHETFAKFDLSVVYVPGKDNTVADCLSRWAYPAGKAWINISSHGDAEETEEAKRIIKMEKAMEQERVKCFVVMANRTDLAKFRGARVQAI